MSGEILLTMNFQENAIMMNEGVLDALQRPQQVQLMVNEEEKMLLMKPCGTQSKDAFVFTPNRIMCVEIDGSALLKSLKRIAGWTSDEPRICPGTKTAGITNGSSTRKKPRWSEKPSR